MEIWTEDSGAGYIYWKCINKHIFNNAFRVVACKGNRDILFKLEKEHSDKFIVLIVDRMLDNIYTAETYIKIQKELRLHKNVVMPTYGCTERSFLTYKNIQEFIGNRNKRSLVDRNNILANSYELGAINLQNAKLNSSKTSESIYKAVLDSLTNGTHAFISGNHIGNCWLFDCCNYKEQTCNNLNINITDKIQDILNNSEFGNTVGNINTLLGQYIASRYKDSQYDLKYKQYVFYAYKENDIEIAQRACKYLLETGAAYWNYERLYRRYLK